MSKLQTFQKTSSTFMTDTTLNWHLDGSRIQFDDKYSFPNAIRSRADNTIHRKFGLLSGGAIVYDRKE